MKPTDVRRLVLLAATALAAGVLVSAPVQAATGKISYSCQITSDYKFTFSFDQDTNLPPKIYVGRSYGSTYRAVTLLPENGVQLARFFGVTSFDGAIDATVLVNGVGRTVHAPIPRTPVPPTASQAETDAGGLVLTATGPLGALGKASTGALVLKPSAIKFTVNAYKSDDSKLFGVDKAPCTMAPNTRVLDTVTAVRSATTTTETVTSSKAAQKIGAAATISRVSGVPATGTVSFALYRGSTRLRTITSTITANRASAAFTGIKAKGTYRVVGTYAGSAALNGSTATRTLTLR
jgi:hypothetical protein